MDVSAILFSQNVFTFEDMPPCAVAEVCKESCSTVSLIITEAKILMSCDHRENNQFALVYV